MDGNMQDATGVLIFWWGECSTPGYSSYSAEVVRWGGEGWHICRVSIQYGVRVNGVWSVE